MTDKEKEAIEYISELDKTKIFYNNPPSYNNLSMGGAIDILLNLIENQQSEMFKLQAKVDRLKVARNNWKKTFYQAEEEIEKYKYLYQKALYNTIKSDRENIEKDKIIDEMAQALKEYANLGFLIKCPAEYDGKYNYKYCKIDITKDRTEKTKKLCINCIKDYFKKKVEE